MTNKVLIVDDDPVMRRTLERYLSVAGYGVLLAENGAEALRIMRAKGPRIVITDWMMPEMDGLELCRVIRSSEMVGFVFIIILTVHSDTDRVVEAFDAGADDYLSKPFHRQELLARLKAGTRIIQLEAGLARQNREIHKVNAELAILNEKFEKMATTDELTGLANRRHALDRLNEFWAMAERHDQPFACVMMDIDHFKRCNDTYGHDVGDLVLRETARILSDSARVSDTVCRLGGEEFLVLCPHTNVEAVVEVAERLRKAVEAAVMKCEDAEFSITMSAGVAGRGEVVRNPNDLLKKSDAAMYLAKRSGRNRVCVAKGGKSEVGSNEHVSI